MKSLLQLTFPCALLLMLCSCAVGPNYQPPEVANLTPTNWHWKLAEPKDALPKGDWWKVFHDSVLDELESIAVTNNQNLRAAVARVDQARAGARLTRSEFFPNFRSIPRPGASARPGICPRPFPSTCRPRSSAPSASRSI